MTRIRAEVEARKLRNSTPPEASVPVNQTVPPSPPIPLLRRIADPVVRFLKAARQTAENIYRLPRNIRNFLARVDAMERTLTQATDSIAAIRHEQHHRHMVTEEQTRVTNLEIAALKLAEEKTRAEFAARADSIEHSASVALDLRTGELRKMLQEHWRTIVDQKLRIEGLLPDAQSERKEVTEQQGHAGDAVMHRIAAEKEHLLDAFYITFEDSFRGTRADIKNRQRFYLPRLAACVEATGGGPVVDVGCGRGEWLELLGESGIAAYGFDLNRIAVEESRSRGADARLQDAWEALRAQPDNSLAAVTGFHIIEHLPFDRLVQLLDQCLRVLRPGGMILFETPNPANLLVAAERFYFDPTHRNPLPSELMSYLVASRGFERVEVVALYPVEWPRRSYDDPMLTLLQNKLFGSQDYSVIGRKAS